MKQIGMNQNGMNQTSHDISVPARDLAARLHLANICVDLLVAAAVPAQARRLAVALLPAPVTRAPRAVPVPEHAG